MLPIFAYATYILLCVRLSPSSPLPSLSFPCYPLPLSGLQRLRRRRPEAYVGLRLQRGFASERPLASIWYRSAAFLATCGIRIDHYIRETEIILNLLINAESIRYTYLTAFKLQLI